MKKDQQPHNKSKILCIGPLPPPMHGSAMMTQNIKDSEYINRHVDLDWINLSTSRKMEEIGQRSPAKAIRFAASYVKTFAKLLTKRYNACYLAITCHGMGLLKDAPFVLMCKAFGCKVILHQHNKGMDAYADRPFYRWLLKRVYSNARVILLSWTLYDDIRKIVEKSQVRICANGIADATEGERTPHDRPVILFLSNMIESKGVVTLLDACQILKNHGYQFECKFVGGETIEFDKSRFIRERDARNLEDMVTYAGRKLGAEKHKEFSNADIFVFPTYYHNECFPLVILEAMQHSLPVVSTNEGAIADIVDQDETGIIVPARQPEQLANALAQLLDSPEKRDKLGNNGKNKYSSNFTLRIFEENMLSCLTEL